MNDRPLKILHVFRAPLGGLFRHVADVVRGQIERGHHVGLIADCTPQGPHPERVLDELNPRLALGLTRIPIGRHLGPGDLVAGYHIDRRIRATQADVVHGHGAKGGAFARLCAPGHPAVRVYTLHGGSLLYRPGTLSSRFYIMLERILKPRTDLFLFESAYIARLYRDRVGDPNRLTRVVPNGVGEAEFAPVTPKSDATDILFIGELRPVKGVDVLLNALSDLRRSGLQLTATIVGSGPERGGLKDQARRLGLEDAVRFLDPMPARQAFPLGRIAVVPSRAESMPYIVLEMAAAGLPMIATDVGGIPDIFGPQAERLLRPEDRPALGNAIASAVKTPQTMIAAAAALRDRVRAEFSIEAMVDGVITGYREAIAARRS